MRTDRLAKAARLAPNLDRLARSATVFTQAFTNGPYTKAAMPALLYSAHYSAFLVRRGEPGFRSLPERLREGGFTTMAVQTNAYLASAFGWGRGFDHYDESILPWLSLTPKVRLERQLGEKRGKERLRGALERALLYLLYCKGAVDCRTVNRKFRALLRRVFRPGRPHFALLHYMDLHEPVVLPRSLRRGLPRLHPHRVSERAHASPQTLTGQEWRFLQGSYDAALSLVDSELGRLLADPRVAEFVEDALLIVTADHGEELGERGRYGHHTRFYESLLRVPLVIKLPGQNAGRTTDALVCHLDVAPTVLEACGIGADADLAGRSLLGQVCGHVALEERPVIAEALLAGREWTLAVRTRRHKLIEATRELFDLEADPEERVNLYGREPELVAQLEAILAAHRRQARPPGVVIESDLVNQRLRERLRGLGYLE